MAYAGKLIIIGLVCNVIHSSFYEACTFDQIQSSALLLPRVTVPYYHPNNRNTRSVHAHFSPIRIYIHYRNQTDLVSESLSKLQNVVQDAILRIKTLLSVIPVNGRLFLVRKDACEEIHIRGINAKKCARLKANYPGEFCLNKVDSFKIPDEHLMGENVYSSSSTSPLSSSIPNGVGAPDSDFILYVSAKHSPWCLQQNLIAYASYCQLDQYDRPIAGFVNFCPSYFISSKYTRSHLIQAAIHEIFHALGFSSELFSKYKDCQQIGSYQRQCYIQKDPVLLDPENGAATIHLPSVVREAGRHFNCSEELGVPLEHTAYGISSHWHPLVMYGSIMAPSFKQPDIVSIDPITLSLFSNTGWYQVNFSGADSYTWAKNSGCAFLLSPNCSNYPFLCNVSHLDEHGCVSGAKGMTECLSVSDINECGVAVQNAKVCCSNCTNNISDALPLVALEQDMSTEGSVQKVLDSKVRVPVILRNHQEVGKLQRNLNRLKAVFLKKVLDEVCIPKVWILKSTLKPTQGNGSYVLDLLIQRDSSTSEDEERVILGRLDKYLARVKTLTVDPKDVLSTNKIPIEIDRDISFLNGWEAIVVLGGIFFSSLILAILYASFMQIKGRIRHTIMSLPQRIR